MAMSRSLGATSFTTRSPILISPLVISSSPARQRRAVVFPQPDGPTSTRNSLSSTAMFKLLTAVTSPYFLTTFWNVTLAMILSSVSWEYSDSIILPIPFRNVKSNSDTCHFFHGFAPLHAQPTSAPVLLNFGSTVFNGKPQNPRHGFHKFVRIVHKNHENRCNQLFGKGDPSGQEEEQDCIQ